MTSSSLHKTKPDFFEEVFATSSLLSETNLAFGDEEEAKYKSIVIIIIRTRVIKSGFFLLGDFQLEIISLCYMMRVALILRTTDDLR